MSLLTLTLSLLLCAMMWLTKDDLFFIKSTSLSGRLRTKTCGSIVVDHIVVIVVIGTTQADAMLELTMGILAMLCSSGSSSGY
jgi:hypothetical protein